MAVIFNFFKKRPIYLYYLVLLLFVVLRTSEQEPNILVRIAFLTAFFVPLIATKYWYLFPACLICFMTIGTYGYAYNFFPYAQSLYIAFPLAAILLGNFNRNKRFPLSVAILIFFTCIINIVYSWNLPDFDYSLIVVSLLSMFIIQRNSEGENLLLNCFCIISISLSLIYLLNFDRFVSSYNETDGIERAGWTDPNYLSTIIGMGVITSLIQLFNAKKSGVISNLIYVFVILVSLSAQILLASRGGLLAVCTSSMILLMLTKSKPIYKILIILILGIFIFYLYNNDYFRLLEYRISHDSGNGSGRTEIWSKKISDFFSLNFIQLIFGIGYEKSLLLGGYGYKGGYGFHNDFVAILCNYGIIGLITFVGALIYPIKKAWKQKRLLVFPLVCYLAVTCMTLEPISAGRLTYFGFYLLILVFSNTNNNGSSPKNIIHNTKLSNRRNHICA